MSAEPVRLDAPGKIPAWMQLNMINWMPRNGSNIANQKYQQLKAFFLKIIEQEKFDVQEWFKNYIGNIDTKFTIFFENF